MKQTTCGVLLLDPNALLLLCHMTGTPYWDIPKGIREDGESEVEAAIRETAEECGLVLSAPDLLELGRFPYRPAKDLHLYAALRASPDAAKLHCASQFRDRWGRLRPEVDDFRWVPIDEVPKHCAPSMAKVLTQRLDLTRVLERLSRPRDPGRAQP